MELEDIIPENPEFTLKSTGKTYALRLVDLTDQVWLKEKFGSNEAFNIHMKNSDWTRVILFVYRLMKDKTDFMGEKETLIDDDGVSKEVFITGPFKLLRKISGQEEATHVMGALARSIMLSNPLINNAITEMMKEEVKKNLTGLKSSITSQPNTDGPQT